MKLSIIIPVYNVEPFISRCLYSCFSLDIPQSEYEIIVVDDGSPDNSIDIVKTIIEKSEAAGEDRNIRIIRRKNGGLSAARNTGLDAACGDFVWFVDSDDWIEPSEIGALLDKVYTDRLDVLCFGLQLRFPDGSKKAHSIQYEESGRVYTGADFICRIGMPPAAWCAIYKRDFLENNRLRFYEGILHEDQEFTPRAYCLASRISYVDKVIYNYFQREGSIMKSQQRERKCISLLTVSDSLYDFIRRNQCNMSQDAFWVMMNHVSFAFSQSLAYCCVDKSDLETYRTKPYYPLNINPLLSKKNKWKYRLINFSLECYLKLYRLK